MTAIVKNRNITNISAGTAVILSFAGLVLFPEEVSAAAKDGMIICFNVIIPSLFPFFVLSSLTVELGLAEWFGRAAKRFMRPLFNVGGHVPPRSASAS
jgi:hypothetical protein